ncbi:UbiA family prenyltransferase [Nocardioides lentus]|uniref:UbiA family prenyltransferase n=1 Tax=Nocardioides lentus TaxID=338077 RepID=A0ABP5ANG4_9ACTN
MASGSTIGALVRSCHPAPAVAVTVLAALLAAGAGADVDRTVVVVAAVLAGQLSIGWSNDLVDAARDRRVGRTDKPAATGELPVATLRTATGVALVLAVALPLVLGVSAGPGAATTGLLVVAGGWAYNLGLKATVLSWLPYAVAFGALPAFVLLADGLSVPGWMPVAGALLGVGAHVLNVVPDLDDDAATGVRGMPHRLGARRAVGAGAALLVLATVVMALGAPVRGATLALLAVVVGALALVAVLRGGRTAFRAAMAIALVDVALLVLAQGAGA